MCTTVNEQVHLHEHFNMPNVFITTHAITYQLCNSARFQIFKTGKKKKQLRERIFLSLNNTKKKFQLNHKD